MALIVDVGVLAGLDWTSALPMMTKERKTRMQTQRRPCLNHDSATADLMGRMMGEVVLLSQPIVGALLITNSPRPLHWEQHQKAYTASTPVPVPFSSGGPAPGMGERRACMLDHRGMLQPLAFSTSSAPIRPCCPDPTLAAPHAHLTPYADLRIALERRA